MIRKLIPFAIAGLAFVGIPAHASTDFQDGMKFTGLTSSHEARHSPAQGHRGRYRVSRETGHRRWRVRAGGGPGRVDAKLAQIMRACPGAHRTPHGGYRHSAGYHGSDSARDVTGPDYGCIYAQLAGWDGGLSTDPGRVSHVHFDDRGYTCHFAHRRRGCDHALPYSGTYFARSSMKPTRSAFLAYHRRRRR